MDQDWKAGTKPAGKNCLKEMNPTVGQERSSGLTTAYQYLSCLKTFLIFSCVPRLVVLEPLQPTRINIARVAASRVATDPARAGIFSCPKRSETGSA